MTGWIAAIILYMLGIPLFVAVGEPDGASWRSYRIALGWPVLWLSCIVSGILDELRWRRRTRG